MGEETNIEIAKKFIMEYLEGGMTQICVDINIEGVVIPDTFKHPEEGRLFLNFSYAFGTTLTVDDFGLKQRLSFYGVESDVAVPWAAVVAARPMYRPEHPISLKKPGLKVVH